MRMDSRLIGIAAAIGVIGAVGVAYLNPVGGRAAIAQLPLLGFVVELIMSDVVQRPLFMSVGRAVVYGILSLVITWALVLAAHLVIVAYPPMHLPYLTEFSARLVWIGGAVFGLGGVLVGIIARVFQ